MNNSPLRSRWQPTRSGLINLFKYENQTFRYENGRLLLRGNNGSGKSRVLALQLPFLLDGEMSPHRVEPDRDPAKRMEWHLLMDTHEHRSGYTWIEFGRNDNGQPRYLTLGCGMTARKGSGSPKRWFFITPQRIGTEFDLDLVTNRTPLTKQQLVAALADSGGTLYERSGEYRTAVDDHLFKLGRRYAPLLDLLIQLRQPQLMREMKEGVLSDALSEALPPVSESIINEVAESFEGLDADRQRTEAFREILDTVETFREGYRQYLAVAIRRLCEVVRTGHSQFENAVRNLREIDQQISTVHSTLTSAQSQAEHTATSLATLESEIQTLRDSPEMRSKRELEQAAQHAKQREDEAQAASEELHAATVAHQIAIDDRTQRQAKTNTCQADTESKQRDFADSHRIIANEHDTFFDWQTTDLAHEQSRIRDLTHRHDQAIQQIRRRNQQVTTHQHNHQRNIESCQQCASTITDSEEKVRSTQSLLGAEIEHFAQAAAAWQTSLTILAFPTSHHWDEVLTTWLQAPEGEFPFRQKITECRDHAQVTIANRRAAITNHRQKLQSDRTALSDELTKLQQGHQPTPTTHHTRSERPKNRPGAPFWKRFEFRDEIPIEERAGWEAALESSGLLDAWVFPNGVLESIFNDDFLTTETTAPSPAAPPVPEASLAAILQPTEEIQPLTSLLQRIGNHRDSAHCWIDRDGHWANGPRHGQWSKPEAEYLGHHAREESRQRRIAQTQSQIADIDHLLAQLTAEETQLQQTTSTLNSEVRAAPDQHSAQAIAAKLDQQRETLQEHKTQLIEAEKRASTSEHDLTQSIARRDTDAADMGLASWATPELLTKFENHLNNFKTQALQFWPAWQQLLDATHELTLAIARENTANDTRNQRHQQHEQRNTQAQQARARANTLLASVGATVQELMNRLRAAESTAEETKSRLTSIQTQIQTAEREQARLEERQHNATQKRQDEEERRNHAVARMSTFATEQLFAEVSPDYQPTRHDLSPTAAVELSRRIEQDLKNHPHDDDHWNQSQSAMTQRFNELSDQLGRHGHHPKLRSIDETSVCVIRCDFRSKPRTIRQLGDLVRAELDERRRFLEEREREVIENHLIGEAANELQQRIRNGEEWVTNVNEELTRVTTSSGIQLKFDWLVASPDNDTLKAVRGTFLKTSAAWTPTERDAIARFLQNRIRAAREDDETIGWRAQLGQALDYRAWHRFGILRRDGTDTGWKKLTRQTFGTGSGGEKAMTLTLPQFAAAAAHYKSAHPHAPRLILLDEVFVAIDAPTRSRLMGLLETFDLDYVMTSEREWGVYPTVTALAIYQLATRKDLNAIAVTRWIWNGHDKIRDNSDND